VFGVESLSEAVGIITGQLEAEPVASRIDELFDRLGTYEEDFADVRGQELPSAPWS
jgi:magnesium chelatase family protein